jgi:hypothetical protein
VIRARVLLLGFLSASCDVSTIELLADLPDGGSLPRPDASGGLPPSRDGSPRPFTPECTTSEQCAAPLRHCDPVKQYCVECLSDGNCADDQMCNESSGQCLRVCAEDGDCVGQAASLCDMGRGFCVECYDDSQCTSPSLPSCLDETGQCVQCETDAVCTTGTEIYCSPRFNSCDACLRDDHCGVNEFCNKTTGSCMAVEPL